LKKIDSILDPDPQCDMSRKDKSFSDSSDLCDKMETSQNLPERTKKLISLLDSSSLDCSVCLSQISNSESIYSCRICYSIVHLDCFNTWIPNSPTCPVCSSPLSISVQSYNCFCGKTSDTQKCKDKCGRKLRGCDHTCSLICHPGECERCPRTQKRSCFCGDLEYSSRCVDPVVSCGGVCQRILNCKICSCEDECHKGDCRVCSKTVSASCYHGGIKEVACGSATSFTCLENCNRYLFYS
jgi:hypothetical protein